MVVSLPYDVNYILGLLESMSINTSDVNQTLMFDMLNEVNWDNFVLDRTALAGFFEDLGIDPELVFFNDLWPGVQQELGIIDLEYDVNYVLYLLETLGVDTTTIDAYLMQEILMSMDADFVLDNYSLEEFLVEIGVDSTTFDPNMYMGVKAELGIVELPLEANYIISLLEFVEYDTSSLNATAIQEWLMAVDWDNFVLDETALNDFYYDFNITSDLFNQNKYTEVLAELGVDTTLPYDTNYILGLLA